MLPQEFTQALETMGIRTQQDASHLLGISRSKVGEYKNGSRKIPAYIAASVRAHLLLTDEQRSTLMKLALV